jgi:hypothetical protein
MISVIYVPGRDWPAGVPPLQEYSLVRTFLLCLIYLFIHIYMSALVGSLPDH